MALCLFAFCWLVTMRLAADDFSADSIEHFEKEVRPLLVKHCYECHGDGKIEAWRYRNWVVDGPIAALLRDLKSRGLLEDTLVLWGDEFGRTPTAERDNGREHHPFGFTMWMAGGGIRGGMVHGATDEFGWHTIEEKVHVHDLHATILHLIGLDHERLTYRFGGRDYRLTDVYGNIVDKIIV